MSDRSPNHHSLQQRSPRRLIGLIPAAGKATRLQPLPFSKELYPIGFQWLQHPDGLHPKPVCVHLLEKMRLAGATEAYIVLRDGKWDIPAYLSDGATLNMHLAYLMMGLPYGVPFTLDQAYPFTKNATVFFGFPDILFRPDDAFRRLLSKQDESGADIVIGLFQPPQPTTMDMVDLDCDGRIRGIQLKPFETTSSFTWIIACWAPSFSLFLHEYVSAARHKADTLEKNREVYISQSINAAIQSGLQVDSVIFHDGNCLDIGTPENLVTATNSAPEAPWRQS